MKLLIITQKVDQNDAILGFFHRWIIEFAKHVDQLIVICLEKGDYQLPANVRVLSLGKERGVGRTARVAKLYSYLWRERGNYDAVFVHMNPVYIVLGGALWKLLGKKITLWYTHKHVDLKLKIAAAFADTIFTASKESFRLKSSKVHVVGHGIDVDEFAPSAKQTHEQYSIVSIGRISSTKNQFILVQACNELFKYTQSNIVPIKLTLVGGPLTAADVVYEARIKKYISDESMSDTVSYLGSVSPDEVVRWYQSAHMFVNLSTTGSLDKAVLEAMACGLQILTSNEAFKNIVPPENFTTNDPATIAEKILALSRKPAPVQFREYIVQHHNLATLIPRLVTLIQER